ncbi:hypothetical protein QQS21_012666 [Conoideocrella luteorostrata]|uniref:Uncharacterized protein n=1 Tax=Conoideocrella luteorostrata TaxID=1105319 RepID=A0AAJ0CB23_9HYPO|nr:hypothetical protein QQS21_012666 [Conoideocrella luteorostrata]
MRLKIPCVGSGQQRYKFSDQTEKLTIVDHQVAKTKRPSPPLLALSRIPSNTTTITSGALVSILEVTDPRYDISCFGPFTKQLPQRLGRSPALDASASAFVSALRDLRNKQVTTNSLTKYVGALNAVQRSLEDRTAAYSVETLCAIYFIMVTQPWLSVAGDRYPSHGQGMSHLLRTLVEKQSNDDFVKGLIATVSVVVILEGLFNPAIDLDPWIHKVFSVADPEDLKKAAELGINFRSVDLPYFCMLPELVRNPEQNFDRIKSYYNTIRIDYPGVKAFGETVLQPQCNGPATSMPLRVVRAQSSYQAGQCLMLTIALALNAFLRKHYASDELLMQEKHDFCADTIQLAERALPRRPLAAAHIPLCLIAAWLVSTDLAQQTQMDALLDEYQKDYALVGSIRSATILQQDETTGTIRKIPRFPCNFTGVHQLRPLNQRSAPEAYCAEYCCIL